MLSDDQTFDYVFEVTKVPVSGMQGRLLEAIERGPYARRLVGYAPVFDGVEHSPQPGNSYARITLAASDRLNATVAAVSFSVERGLVRVLRPGDLLHLTRSSSGMGLSIVRDRLLIAAAGNIAGMPLGSDVSVRYPGDLIRQANAIFQTRDPEYRMKYRPIELTVAGHTRILEWGRPTMGSYDVFIRRTGTLDPWVSIERTGVCPETAAHSSAELLAGDCEITPWPTNDCRTG
jgi:hypothetical protein